jgi:hypothetical protein
MNVWREFAKKREGTDRFVVNGLAFAVVGVGMGVLSLVFDWSFLLRSMSVSFVFIGLTIAGVASVVIAYRKRDGTGH